MLSIDLGFNLIILVAEGVPCERNSKMTHIS